MRIYSTTRFNTSNFEHLVIGGEIHEDGTDTIKFLNFHVIFPYAVKAIQEQSEIAKQQQKQIDEQNQNRQINEYDIIFVGSTVDVRPN